MLPNDMLFSEYLTASRFYVELLLDGNTEADGLFMECKGLKYSQDVIEFAESYPQPWGKASVGRVMRTKLPGNGKVSDISLRRGMSASTTLWQWIYEVQNGNWAKKWKDGSLTLYRQNGQPGARFQFFRAWPVNYTVADSSVSNSDLAVEDLDLTCEELIRVPIS
jgi:phage tail-like protein